MSINIDEEFRALIRPQTEIERKHLEEAILADGCRDPLVVWDGVLIDGHNRLEICTKHGIEYDVEEMQFESRVEAMNWIDKNQMGRRNLTRDEFTMILGRLYSREKKAVGGDYTSEKALAQNELKVNTAEKVAKEFGVSPATVKRAEKVYHKVEEVKQERRTEPQPTDTHVEAEEELQPLESPAPMPTPPQPRIKTAEEIRAEQDAIMEEAKRRVKEENKKKADAKLEERKKKIEANLKNDIGPTKPTITKCDAVKFLESVQPFDLLITDPPYSTDVPDIKDFAASWLPLALSKMKPKGRAYICIGAYPEELAAYLNIAMPAQVLVWTYRNTLGPTPKDNYKLNWQAILYYKGEQAGALDCPVMLEQFSVQDINAPDGRLGDRYHAWQKPMELADRFIRHSTKPGDFVVDCFACTGTFLLSAAKLGRTATGCDISAENIAIAKQRGCHESIG